MSPRLSTGVCREGALRTFVSKSGDLPKKKKPFPYMESGGDDGKVPTTTVSCGGTFFLRTGGK